MRKSFVALLILVGAAASMAGLALAQSEGLYGDLPNKLVSPRDRAERGTGGARQSLARASTSGLDTIYIGHSIQTIGDKPCHFILAFDNGAFSEHGTFSITDWIDVTPKDMLALSFGVPKDVFDAFPKGETYIQAGPVLPASEACALA